MRGLGLGLGLGLERSTALPFNVLNLFENGEEGAWYGPSDLSTLFQDETGTIPAVPGSPVGLVLDARKEMGPVALPVDDFSQGWTATSPDVTFVDGSAVFTSVGASVGVATAGFQGTAGKWYQVEIEVSSFTSGGNIATRVGQSGSYARIAPRQETGKFKVTVQCHTNGPLRIHSDSTVNAVTATITNVSVREVLNPPLSQPTTAARPILARMPKTGRRNIVKWSQDLLNPVWQFFDVSGNAARVDDNAFQLGNNSLDRIVQQSLAGGNGDQTLSFTLSGSGEVRLIMINALGGSTAAGATITLSPTPTRYHLHHNFSSNTLGGVGIYSTGSPAVVTIHNAQAEPGTEPTPYQRVTNAYDITEEGVPDTYRLVYDLADDALTTTLPQAINGDLLIAGTKGSIIEPVSYAAGSSFTLGPDTYTGGTPGIMRAIGDIVGVVLIDRTLTQTERDVLIEHYKGKGAKGLLVPGPELVVNGDVAQNIDEWSFLGPASLSWVNGRLRVQKTGTGTYPVALQEVDGLTLGGLYRLTANFWNPSGRNVRVFRGGAVQTTPRTSVSGTASTLFWPTLAKFIAEVGFEGSSGAEGEYVEFKNISLRELRPQEDWT